MVDRLSLVIEDQILLANVSDVAALGILGEQVIEGLVLGRPDFFRNGLIPFVAVGKFGIDIEHHAAKIEQAMADDLVEPTAPSIEERVGDDATLRAVLQAFSKLSPEDQQLMRLLCAVPPIDYQTIAEMLGRPIGSIGPTRARCLERLKKLLPPGLDPKEGP